MFLLNVNNICDFFYPINPPKCPLGCRGVNLYIILEEKLESWTYVLERRGMKVNRRKTEYMCVNERMRDRLTAQCKCEGEMCRKWRISNIRAQLYKVGLMDIESAEEK